MSRFIGNKLLYEYINVLNSKNIYTGSRIHKSEFFSGFKDFTARSIAKNYAEASIHDNVCTIQEPST